MRNRLSLSSRAFVKRGFAVLTTFFLVLMPPMPSVAQAGAKGVVKPNAKVAEVIDLPIGHVGQHYETKILGVKGVDIGDASCTVSPELPPGLDLDCERMTIAGRPREAVEGTPLRITVSDTSGDSVAVDLSLTVIEGPDIVRIGTGRPSAALPVAAPAPRTAPTRNEPLARTATVPPPLPASPASKPLASAGAGRIEFVAASAHPPKPSVPSGTAAESSESARSNSAAGADDESQKFEPLITSDVSVDATVVSGTAKALDRDKKVTIALVSDDGFEDQSESSSDGLVEACLNSDKAQEQSDRFLPIVQGSGTSTGTTAQVDENGHFSMTLKSPLVDGQRFHAAAIQTEASYSCHTKVRVAKSPLNWGRIHADFAAGILISNDSTNSTTGSGTAGSGNFSQAHQFYALSVEKSWSLPGCYLRVFSRPHSDVVDGRSTSHVADQCYDWKSGKLYDARRWQHLWPGLNTYFQTRLTAIPVTTIASKNTRTTNDTASGTAQPAAHALASAATPDATTSSDPATNIISTAQTAKVEVGAYLPFFVTRWEYNNRPNALFIAPLAKVGFDTVTGPSSAITIAPDGTVQTQTFEQVYNYWSYGARVGHMELSRSESKAPETFSYLDIAIGPYSSLQSYICHPGSQTLASPSTCATYPNLTGGAVDSRKRLYRFDIEGLLKIPRTAFYVGLNANIGQKTLGADHLDRGFAAPDDLRFFFGTKFDIASVLAKYNLGPH